MVAQSLITPSQLAEEWGVSYETILGLISNGSLPFFRVGRQWRARRKDIETRIDNVVGPVVAPFGKHKRAKEFGG